MKVNHVEWLLFSNDDQKYYSLITREFGGQGDVEAAIRIRQGSIDLRWIGQRNIGEQAPQGGRRIFPLDMSELDKFQIITCFKEYVQADIDKIKCSSDDKPCIEPTPATTEPERLPSRRGMR